MELDPRELLRIARRRGWILLLIVVAAGLAGFVMASRQEEQYSATAKVVVLAGEGTSDSEYTTLLASRSLAETYRLLIETGPVLDEVIARLDLPYSIDALDAKVSTFVIGETQVIGVTVTDTDPTLAAHIATSIVEEFQLYIKDRVDSSIGAQVEVADPARVPVSPISPRPLVSVVVGVFLGLLLGLITVAVLEFADNAVTSDRDLQELTGAPVIATIAAIKRLEPGHEQVYTLTAPRSSAAEAVRLLRTNLEFASATSPINVLTVSSPGPGEGKSTMVANLGVVMAQAGLRTVLIDGDLRRPTLSQIFGVQTESGLTTLLTRPEQSWSDVASTTFLPSLQVISSGPLPPNPFDLVSSPRFAELIATLRSDSISSSSTRRRCCRRVTRSPWRETPTAWCSCVTRTRRA